MTKRIEQQLAAAGCAPVALDELEVRRWLEKWRRLYAKELHAKTGKWLHDYFDWHVFSFGHHPAKTRDAAREAYRAVAAGDFVVVPGYAGDDLYGFRCTGRPPILEGRMLDVLVMPTTLAWTMAFTHEQPDLGPYFAEP
jgi:hypothetical protein